ncbi:hypothetical protein [Salirhabdus sp. Marseille-P4669]|uniref:hypothetical protein n=1 Tax=Salirhabdus sp. Marseille-P4669 TaxID=2042310 RepID=UPI000C7C2ADE|nr:hypothetical protein [Salirhabdus sp. Marseille-P4669]
MSLDEIAVKVMHDENMFKYIPIIRRYKHTSIDIIKYKIENQEPVITCPYEHSQKELIKLYQTLIELIDNGAQFEMTYKNKQLHLDSLKRMISIYSIQLHKSDEERLGTKE